MRKELPIRKTHLSTTRPDETNVIDLESCFDPIFDPPQSFLDACRKYWENYYDAMMSGKPAVPTFYVRDEDGTLYFYHGKSRIRVSEHFRQQGKTFGEIAADAIRFEARARAPAVKAS